MTQKGLSLVWQYVGVAGLAASFAFHSASQGRPIALFPLLPENTADHAAAAYGALMLPVILGICWLAGLLHAKQIASTASVVRLPDTFGLGADAETISRQRLQWFSFVAFVLYPAFALIHCLRKFLKYCSHCWQIGVTSRIDAGGGKQVDVVGFWQPLLASALSVAAFVIAVSLIYHLLRSQKS